MIPKYRAWHIARKQMYKVVIIDFEAKKLTVESGFTESLYFPFDEIILMESTGLLDINEVEIFEDDIMITNTEFPFKVIYEVDYARWRFITLDEEQWGESFSGFHNEYKIIGNIHEHPDPLSNDHNKSLCAIDHKEPQA